MTLKLLGENRAALHLGSSAINCQQTLASEALLRVLDHLILQSFFEPLEGVSPLEQNIKNVKDISVGLNMALRELKCL